VNLLDKTHAEGRVDAHHGKPPRPHNGERLILRQSYLCGWRGEHGRMRRAREFAQLDLFQFREVAAR